MRRIRRLRPARPFLPSALARRLSAAALLVVGVSLLGATIWTRSTNLIKVPRGNKQPLPNALYATREWQVVVSSVEVKEDVAAHAGSTTPRWIFYYRNTDKEPHYVAISVQCQDAQRRERGKFSYTAALEANQKDESSLEILARSSSEDWNSAFYARITIDFLSGPKE